VPFWPSDHETGRKRPKEKRDATLHRIDAMVTAWERGTADVIASIPLSPLRSALARVAFPVVHSVPALAPLLARPIDLGVHHAHVSGERIVA
jgi:hypothetical protein